MNKRYRTHHEPQAVVLAAPNAAFEQKLDAFLIKTIAFSVVGFYLAVLIG